MGLTEVAFGTSSPELAVSVQSAWSGRVDSALGHVVGGNIFNILFILGLSELITPRVAHRQLIRQGVPLMVGISLLLWVLASAGVGHDAADDIAVGLARLGARRGQRAGTLGEGGVAPSRGLTQLRRKPWCAAWVTMTVAGRMGGSAVPASRYRLPVSPWHVLALPAVLARQ